MPTASSNEVEEATSSLSTLQEDYQRHLLRAQGTGNYFMFRRDYVTSGLLRKVPALFLQDLINHASMPGTRWQEFDGESYFLCTREYLQGSLGWDKDSQNDLLRQLQERGFIQTTQRGMPKRRWVKINLWKIEKELDERLSGRKNPPAGQSAEKPAHRTAGQHSQRTAEKPAHSIKKNEEWKKEGLKNLPLRGTPAAGVPPLKASRRDEQSPPPGNNPGNTAIGGPRAPRRVRNTTTESARASVKEQGRKHTTIPPGGPPTPHPGKKTLGALPMEAASPPRGGKKAPTRLDPRCLDWVDRLHSAREKKSRRRFQFTPKDRCAQASYLQSMIGRVRDPDRIEEVIAYYESHEVKLDDGREYTIIHPKQLENGAWEVLTGKMRKDHKQKYGPISFRHSRETRLPDGTIEVEIGGGE